MENKNYYPLRIGSYSSVIVSDTDPGRVPYDGEAGKMDNIKHYGGHLIAESIPPELAQQLVDAYNEKYGLEMKDFQVKFDAKVIIQRINEINSRFNVMNQDAKVLHVRAEFQKLSDYIFNTFHSLYHHKEETYDVIDGKKIANPFLENAMDFVDPRPAIDIKERSGALASKHHVKADDPGLSHLNSQIADMMREKLVEDGEVEIQVPYVAIKHLKHMESCALNGNKITRIDNYYHMVTHYGYEYRSDRMSGTSLTVGFLPVMTAQPESVKQVDMRYAKGREKSEIHKEENSAHSFTEGMDTHGVDIGPGTSEVLKKNTLDEQIKLIEDLLKLSRAERSKDDYRIVTGTKDPEKFPYTNTEKIYIGIINNLRAIKRWNESPAYHGKIDVEKVIEDLLTMISAMDHNSEFHNWTQVQNAEAALGMLRAFKEDRNPKTISDDFKVKYPITEKEAFKKMSSDERDAFRITVVSDLPDEPGKYQIATAITNAIEKMLELKGL